MKHMFKDTRLCYSLELVKSGVEFLFTTSKKKQLNSRYDSIRSLLVYCIKKNADGTFIILNRDYKPLGISGYMPYIKYEDFQFMHLRPEQVYLTDLETHDHTQAEALYWLFNDSTYPDSAKTKKLYLSMLMKTFPEIKESYDG